ncbi:MAG: PAS domain S-box protein, partial [candidate division Zixibacteria bacterium]|nr:PAS domain S-box protein [candidate division Zixibacteria bacterium]
MFIFSEKEQSLLDSLDDEVLVLDLSYQILHANDKFLERRGKSLSEVRGKTCHQFFHNSDKPCQKSNKICPLKEVLGNSKPIRTINQEGERYLGVYASPLKDKKGNVTGLIKVFKDITETEKDKKMSEDRYKDIIEKSHDAIAIIQDGKIKLSNQKLVDLLGYTREELDGSDFITGIAPEHSEMVGGRHRKRLNGEQVPDHYEFTVVTKNSQRKDVEMNVVLVEYKGRIGTCCFMRDITEKKKNETQIRELKDYLNNIINTSQVAITVIDNEDNFSIFNQGAERLLGYKAEEVIGKKNVSDFYADKEKYEYMKRKLLKEGLIENFETFLIKKDGSQIPICISVSQLKGQHGQTIGSIGISTDLSERKKVEKALRESEIRLNAVVNNTPNVAIESFDIDGKILYVNKAAEEMFGWTSAEILGKTIGQLSADKGFTEEFLSILRDIDKSNKSYGPSEWKCKNKKRMPLTGYSTIFPIPSTGGKKEFICMDVDITERKKAEELLRENEEKFRNLAEQSPNMIFINKNGKIIYANQKCEEIMGYKREEFYAQDFDYLKLIAPECRDSVNENFIKHLKSEEVQPLEYTLVAQKGEKVDAILTTKLITYEGEKAILGTITDITLRKKTEKKIIQTNVELSALNAIASIVNQSLNLDMILKESLDKVLEVTGSPAGGIYIINQHSEKLELKASKGLSREAVKEIDNLQWGEGFSGRIVMTGESMLVDDITQDSRLTRMIMKKAGLHSFLGVPLKSKGRILGTLFVHSQKKRGYNPEDIELLSSMGNQIGIAVENANLFKEAEQWIVQLDVIRNITNRLNRLNDVKTVALAVMDEIKKVIEFDNCRVFLLNENRDELVPIAFGSEIKEYQGETEETLRLKIGEGI